MGRFIRLGSKPPNSKGNASTGSPKPLKNKLVPRIVMIRGAVSPLGTAFNNSCEIEEIIEIIMIARTVPAVNTSRFLQKEELNLQTHCTMAFQ